MELTEMTVKCRYNLFGDLLCKLSEEGLSDIEAEIIGERYRRKEIKKLELPKAGKEA